MCRRAGSLMLSPCRHRKCCRWNCREAFRLQQQVPSGKLPPGSRDLRLQPGAADWHPWADARHRSRHEGSSRGLAFGVLEALIGRVQRLLENQQALGHVIGTARQASHLPLDKRLSLGIPVRPLACNFRETGEELFDRCPILSIHRHVVSFRGASEGRRVQLPLPPLKRRGRATVSR